MKFNIIKYDEGIFEVDTSCKMPKDKDVEVTINMQPILKYADSIDIIGCQLTMTYSIENNIVLKYGYIVTFGITGWTDFIGKSPSKSDIINYVYEAWNDTINYGRGVLTEKLKNTPFPQLSIPDIPKEKLEEKMEIIKVS